MKEKGSPLRWRGVYPAVATQFGDDQSLDLGASARFMDRLVDDGVDGLVVLGTSGENFTLDAGEKRALLKEAVAAAAGRVPLLAGIAECSTRAACALARDAERIGVDGLLVVPGLVYKSSPREVAAHFRAIAAASALPIMIYNNPGTYGVDIAPELIAELSHEPAFVAAKESSGVIERIGIIRTRARAGFAIFCGADEILLESVAAGALGWISGLVNAFPREAVALFRLAGAGRTEEAQAIFEWFRPVLALDSRSTLVQCLKLAAAMNGRGSATVRGPRLPLEPAERSEVAAVIERAMAARPPLPAG